MNASPSFEQVQLEYQDFNININMNIVTFGMYDIYFYFADLAKNPEFRRQWRPEFLNAETLGSMLLEVRTIVKIFT